MPPASRRSRSSVLGHYPAHQASATVACSSVPRRRQRRQRSDHRLGREPQARGAQQRRPRSGAWSRRHHHVARGHGRRHRLRDAPLVAPALDRHQAPPPSARRRRARPAHRRHSCSAIRCRAPPMPMPAAPLRPPHRRAPLGGEARQRSPTHPQHRAHEGGCDAHVKRSPAPRRYCAR